MHPCTRVLPLRVLYVAVCMCLRLLALQVCDFGLSRTQEGAYLSSSLLQGRYAPLTEVHFCARP